MGSYCDIFHNFLTCTAYQLTFYLTVLVSGLRLMVERLFVERFFTDGQLMEGQYVEITKFKVCKFYTEKGKYNIFIDLTLLITKKHDLLKSINHSNDANIKD